MTPRSPHAPRSSSARRPTSSRTPPAGRTARRPTRLVVSGKTGEGVELLTARLAELARDGRGSVGGGPASVRRAAAGARPVRRSPRGRAVPCRRPRRGTLGRRHRLRRSREVVALQKRFVKEGVERQLVVAGARRGDEVVIGDRAFEFIPERRRPAMGRREELVDAEERGWAEIQRSCDRLTPEQMEGPAQRRRLVREGRPVAPLLLDGRGGRAARADAPGPTSTIADTDGLNPRYLEEGRGQDLATVRAELAACAQPRDGGVGGDRPSFPRRPQEWFEESGALHYHEHLADLRAFARRSRSPNLDGPPQATPGRAVG